MPQEPKDRPSVFSREWNIPFSKKIGGAVRAFSVTEKVIFGLLAAVLAVTGLSLLTRANELITSAVPARGGSFSEGVIGLPRFINPLLALSDTDRDLSSLIYSGLIKSDGKGGYAPDLAAGYEVSDDGLSYTFTLRDGIFFHDGSPITADDVIFTVTEAEDPNLKSPKRVNWEGVKAEKVDEKTVRFTLRQAYAPFLGNLTLGILPKNIWKNVDAEQFPFSLENTEPVGSGPYKIKKIKRDGSGLPIFYELAAWNKYPGGQAYISGITVYFYSNQAELQNAYQNGTIESLSAVAPEDIGKILKAGSAVEKAPSARVFGVFFNQGENAAFARKEVRQALDMAADKTAIVREALGGYATPIDGPIPPSTLDGIEPIAASSTAARALLTKKGWTENKDTGFLELITTDAKTKKKTALPLAFTLSTSNAPELKKTAEILKAEWAKIGADVEIKTYEPADLTQNAIRPRKYDALLFGEVVGADLDLYAFWHSSQRLDPGLNIALYANSKADKLLEKMRTEPDAEVRADEYADFKTEIDNDIPAVFLYSPDFLYIVPEKIQGIALSQISAGSERFAGVSGWYIETDRIWNFLLSGIAKVRSILKTQVPRGTQQPLESTT